jgi:hypothetical protein
MSKGIFMLFGLITIILLGGCIQQKSEENPAINACVNECKSRLNSSEDLSSGPCLSNSISEDWVCDVAHNPRQPVDNIPENQCSGFREGKAHHFVEVDEKCSFIRAV